MANSSTSWSLGLGNRVLQVLQQTFGFETSLAVMCCIRHSEAQLKGCAMDDCFSRSRRRAIRCQRCSGTMDEIMQIEALWDAPGLVAFECPDCGYLTSVVVPPEAKMGAAA